jgi:putative endonuclease
VTADEAPPIGHYVYLLRCRDGTFYAGYTVDLGRRLAQHQAGAAARYTRGRRPVALVACWCFDSPGAALRAEARLKRLPRQAKAALVAVAGGESPSTGLGFHRSSKGEAETGE